MTAVARQRREGPRYPTKAKIDYLVKAAKAAGVKVGGIECARDGTVRILSETMAAANTSAYDAWKSGAE